MNRFCLKQGQGLKASAAHPHAELPLSNPPKGRPSTFAPKLRDLFFSVSLISMEEASTSGLNCCSRDRKGKQREKKMPSENEVDILMRLFKLICSSLKCGNASKSFPYLRLQTAIDIFGMNKKDN